MIELFLSYYLFSLTTIPQNLSWDRYTVIPTLGVIKSIAASPQYLVVLSDNNLIVFDKYSLKLQKTIQFNQGLKFTVYDQYYDGFWIIGEQDIIRYTPFNSSLRGYPLETSVERLGLSQHFLYIDGVHDFSFDKRNGVTKQVTSFPQGITWFQPFKKEDLKKYPFLSPYYYYDQVKESQSPFTQFPITVLLDDGMDLYVGTSGFGLLKYNKISWQKKRIIYGPLDHYITKVKQFNNNIYFISNLGLSYFDYSSNTWSYHRYSRQITDIVFTDNDLIISFATRLSKINNGVTVMISNFDNDILSLAEDSNSIYIGTTGGIFRLFKGTTQSRPFGLNFKSVYAILPTLHRLYVGTETGLYCYEKEKALWSNKLRFGIKDITQINNQLFMLSTNNQLVSYYEQPDTALTDTNWQLLPYFNIYDIASDREVLYCATFAGIYYYEPETKLYKLIYNLPRLKYKGVFITKEYIVALSDNNIYSLPIKDRD